jgi:thioester reductase-like protein
MVCVLITGATGAIGGALVPLFLRDADTQVRLILRAKHGAHLRERLNGLFTYWNDPTLRLSEDRVEAFCGDVDQPRLGLTPDEYDRLSREVTHVVHSAGVVKLNQSIEDARRSAVTAAENVVAFTRACQQHGRFHKLEFVSTVGVAGRTPGLVREEPMTHPRGFHNTYEQAKSEAETFLFGEMGHGLPATIHRPSMVVGDAQTGKIAHFQVFYYLVEFLSGRNTCGFVPTTGGVRLDIVPADYVAAVIHRSSQRADAAGRIFHLCSGPAESLRIADLIVELRRLYQEQGVRLPSLRRVGAGVVRRGLPLVRRLVPPKTRRMLDTLPYFLDYLAEDQVFDDAATRSFFAPDGLRVPPVREYLPRLLRYYWTTKYPPQVASRTR